MLPWSVIPIADISSRCASASMGETFAAPSNIEYSVWLCRCTNDLLIGTPVYDRTPTRTWRVAECVLSSTRNSCTERPVSSLNPDATDDPQRKSRPVMQVKPTKALSGIGIAALIAGGGAGASMLRSPANAGEVKLTAGLGDGVALILVSQVAAARGMNLVRMPT